MSFRSLGAALFCPLACAWGLCATAPAVRAADTYSVKVADKTPAPAEVAEPIRTLLRESCVQVSDAKGNLMAELWFRAEVPAKATEAQIKNGLTYREVPETTLVGVVRFARAFSDYRKQKIMPGVYTLRLANQPMDGDHMGTADYSEFCLLSPAAEDKKPDPLTPKKLQEMSKSSTNASSHPGVMLLFPGKGAAAEPKLVNKGSGHWVLLFLLEVKVGDKATTLPIGLTLVGTSTAA
jgi:hypothetical protein